MDDVIPQSESLSLGVNLNDSTNGDHEAIDERAAEVASLSNGAEENGGENGEEKSGGIITNFITNLVSPKSAKAGEFTKRKVEDEASEGDEIVMNGENGGGGISNMIANFFNPSEEEVKEEVGNKRLKMDEKEEGKGGLIDDIVSHLPTSIPDDAAPTGDEASILIHSCVKD